MRSSFLWVVPSGLFLVSLFAPEKSAAQQGFDFRTLRPAMPASDGVILGGAEVEAPFSIRAGILYDHAFSPLVQKGPNSEEVLLQGTDTTEVIIGVGFLQRLELGASIPVILAQQEGPSGTLNVSGAALGDLALRANVQLYSTDTLALAFHGLLAFPTGDQEKLTSDGGVGGEGRLLIEKPLGPVQGLFSLGFRQRPQAQLETIQTASQATFGLGARYNTGKLSFVGEIFGAIAVNDGLSALNPNVAHEGQSPLEAALSVHQRIGPFVATVGGGLGLSGAVGTPSARVFAGLSFRSALLSKTPTPTETDADGDAFVDSRDKCPTERETFNDFEDADGCPDTKPPQTQATSDEEKAAALFTEGEGYYNVGEYEKALAAYKESYLLSREPALLFNMGQCSRKLGKYQEALDSYRAYLREVPESPVREDVESLIAEIEQEMNPPKKKDKNRKK